MASKAGWESVGRVADDLEDVRCRRLLLQRFGQIVGALAQFVEQPRILDGDHGLVGKGLTSSICLSVNGATSSRVSAKTPITASSRNNGTPKLVR